MKKYTKKFFRFMLLLIPFVVLARAESVSASSVTMAPTPTPKQVQGSVSVSSDNIYDDEEHYNDYENYKVDAPWYCDATTIQLGVVSLEENIINVLNVNKL